MLVMWYSSIRSVQQLIQPGLCMLATSNSECVVEIPVWLYS